MALPLPNVVVPGGPILGAMNAGNSFAGNLLRTQAQGISNQYAPYEHYANAFSKMINAQYLPYMLQSQMLSNPLLFLALKDHPEVAQSMISNFARNLPQSGGMPNGFNMPMPGQGGNGILNSMFGGGQAPQPDQNSLMGSPSGQPSGTQGNPMANPAQGGQGSPLVPASQGGGSMGGYMGNMMAPYATSPYKAGSTISNPNNPSRVLSVPTSKTATATQQALLASNRVLPQLQDLIDEWKPFMTAGQMGKVGGAIIGNSLVPDLTKKYFNENSQLPSQYAEALSTIKTAPESLLKAYGLNVTDQAYNSMKEAIEPRWGETSETYTARILRQMKKIQRDQIEQNKAALYGGFDVTPNQQPASQEQVSPGAKALSKGLQLPKFNSKEEFQQWYAQQPSITQNAIREHLGNK